MKYHNAYVKPIYKEGCCLAMKISSSLNDINHVTKMNKIYNDKPIFVSKILYWGGCNFNQK